MTVSRKTRKAKTAFRLPTSVQEEINALSAAHDTVCGNLAAAIAAHKEAIAGKDEVIAHHRAELEVRESVIQEQRRTIETLARLLANAERNSHAAARRAFYDHVIQCAPFGGKSPDLGSAA